MGVKPGANDTMSDSSVTSDNTNIDLVYALDTFSPHNLADVLESTFIQAKPRVTRVYIIRLDIKRRTTETRTGLVRERRQGHVVSQEEGTDPRRQMWHQYMAIINRDCIL